MLKKDYFMEQVEMLLKTFAALVFGKEFTKEVLTEEDENGMGISPEGRLTELLIDKRIAEGEIDQAKGLILNMVQTKPNAESLRIALCAYNKMQQQGVDEQMIKEEITKIREVYAARRQQEQN